MAGGEVQILGSEHGAEYNAACQLRDTLLPRLRRGDRLQILVGRKCHGEWKQDLDLILLGTFGQGLSLPSPNTERQARVKLVNVAVVIEVKDHPPEKVRIDAGHVKVLYKSGWSDATDQVEKQVLSLRRYLGRGNVTAPFVGQVLWLRNVHKDNFRDSLPNNVLCGQPSYEEVCDLLCRVRPPVLGGDGRPFIAFTRNANINAVAEVMKHLGHSFQPTPLDRKRLEKISQRLVADQKYIKERGKQLLAFRGRGGSGKTVHLVRLAKGLRDDFGDRVLLLTYNHALAADIRRLITLMGIRDTIGDSGVEIQTAESFFVGLISELDEWDRVDAGKDYEAYYRAKKHRVLDDIANLERDEVRELLAGNYDKFGWDYIVIDEAQDWPEDERDLLFAIYGPERCVVADGVDQLVRETTPCDWAGHQLVQGRKQVVPLRPLRLTSNLCRFVTEFASAVNLAWDQDPNDELLGGRVIVVEGDYTQSLHEEIMQAHAQKGNFPIDSLFCLPPESKERVSSVVEQLQEWGLKVWDGTRRDVRHRFPTDREEFRLVKYESCRGLEGWTVVCLGLDKFFENKLRVSSPGSLDDLFETVDEAKRRIALSWCLIPLTRAIDVLVLQVSPGTEVRELLYGVFEQNRDFVEWRQTDGHRN